MTVDRNNFQQGCPTHQKLRAEAWPADTQLREKIFFPLPQKPGPLNTPLREKIFFSLPQKPGPLTTHR